MMTYLIENENAALQEYPHRFIAQTHPHFREVIATAHRAGRPTRRVTSKSSRVAPLLKSDWRWDYPQ